MSTPPGSPPPFEQPRFPAASAYLPPPPARFKRPLGVVLLAILNACGGALLLLGAALMLVGGVASASDDRSGATAAIIVGVICGLIGVFQLATAIGLWTLKGYGRTCQIVSSVIGLLAIPIGTIFSGLILYYLTRPGMKLLFSGRAPADLSPAERQVVDSDSNQSVVAVVILIVALFGGVAMIGIVAAIAIPGLLRARMSGNEAVAIGSMRAMTSAQAVWTSSHNGEHGQPSCLGNPSSCGDTSSQVPYLPADLASLGEKSGYRYGFLLRPARMVAAAAAAEPPVDPGAVPAGESGEPPASDVPTDAEVQRQLQAMPGALPPTPVEPQQELQPGGYVYWAEPVTYQSTGTRRFCTDETGVVLEYISPTGWVDPTPARPACPDGGRPLQ